MIRLPQENSWYGFATIDGYWGAINFAGYIETSNGRVEFPIINGLKDTPLYLVGAYYNGNYFMAGQSQNGNGTLLYISGAGWFQMGPSWGVSPCAFSQDGRFFYWVTGETTGNYRDNLNGMIIPFETPFFADGIRAVIPPANKIILANTTVYSPTYDLHQYIDFENGLVVGQGSDGLVVWYNGIRYLVEPGGTFFIRAMYDGFNLSLDCVKETERQNIVWFLNVVELVLFPVANEDPIVAMNKKCWMTWFEFNDAPPGMDTPLNATVYSGEGAIRRFDNGHTFAKWIQGHSVEDIEVQAASSEIPCVVYWDSRSWPRWPQILPEDWLGLQAYCFLDETPAVFEANMRALLNSVPSDYEQIALVCQVYTSNASLTTNLKGLVPVFARLGKDYPRVNHLIGFTDQGRATGLNDHPEVVPYWQQLFAGITGEPGMVDTQLPQDVWDSVIVPMHDRYAQECIDAHPGDMDSAARMWTKMTNEQVLYSYPDQGYCWKSADPNRPPSKDSQARELEGQFFGWDLLAASGANGPRDLVPYPPATNDLTGQHPIHAGDIPDFGPKNWLSQAPSDMAILVFDYTNPARRSDPFGCTVRFEIASANPVIFISLSVNDGDQPFVWEWTTGKDGRYYRAIAFKVTVNGNWELKIKARDNAGNEVEKVMPITVIA